MKLLVVLSLFLTFVLSQQEGYNCTTYPTISRPSYWTCSVANANGYAYTRSSTSKYYLVIFSKCLFTSFRLLENLYK